MRRVWWLGMLLGTWLSGEARVDAAALPYVRWPAELDSLNAALPALPTPAHGFHFGLEESGALGWRVSSAVSVEVELVLRDAFDDDGRLEAIGGHAPGGFARSHAALQMQTRLLEAWGGALVGYFGVGGLWMQELALGGGRLFPAFGRPGLLGTLGLTARVHRRVAVEAALRWMRGLGFDPATVRYDRETVMVSLRVDLGPLTSGPERVARKSHLE